jgi:hypothetical protein
MQMRIAGPLAVVFLWVCSPVTAQDDVPWWRQMFGDGKATKEVVVEPIAEPIKEGQGMPDSIEDAEEVPVLDVPLGQPVETTLSSLPWGSVDWDVPDRISALDSLHLPAEEVRIPGFRVQLFMGRLDTARSLRQHIVTELELDFEVHLTPYPPIFGVQVGDFRTALAAHRAKRALKPRFPNALVVPAELTVESAFPVAGDCIRTP